MSFAILRRQAAQAKPRRTKQSIAQQEQGAEWRTARRVEGSKRSAAERTKQAER